jgi:hypothetical protein
LCKYLDLRIPISKENILFQSSGKITVKEMPVVLKFCNMDCICIAKKTIGILWKAFEGILNDRAENQQYSIQAFKISCAGGGICFVYH